MRYKYVRRLRTVLFSRSVGRLAVRGRPSLHGHRSLSDVHTATAVTTGRPSQVKVVVRTVVGGGDGRGRVVSQLPVVDAAAADRPTRPSQEELGDDRLPESGHAVGAAFRR